MPLRRLAAACAAAILTACAGSSAAPRTLHMALQADFPGLNPLVLENANVSQYAPLFHGFLLRTDGDNHLIPDLATEVPTAANGGISKDGRTVTYHLRRNVRWHDGAPFDARDVVFSFRAAMNPANNVPDRTGFDHVKTIRALDDHTVRVTLTSAFTPFVPACLTMGANDPYPILPAHLLEKKVDLNHDPYSAKPVGLGPYKVTAWERGARVVLDADPAYWRGKPAIARIELRFVPSANTLGTEWTAGHVDLGVARNSAGRALADTIRRAPGTHVILKPHYQFDYLMFNTARAPLDDERVRAAIVRGIDRHRIMRDLEGDLYLPGEGDRLPGQFAYDPALKQPPYDPAAAAKLLDAAGWRMAGGVRMKNGTPLTLELVGITEIPLTDRFDLIAQQQLAALGVRASLKSYGYNLAWATAAEGGVYQNGRFHLSLSGWQPNGVGDHSYLFRCDRRPPGGENFDRICDPALDAAAQTELTTTDPRVEADADRRITRALVEHAYVLFLGFNQEVLVVRNDLEGMTPSVNGQHYWNAWAWRWKS